MKKVFIALLYVSALVACSRLEVTPIEDSKAAITYQTAPITKAHAEFAHSYVFESAAYYLPPSNPSKSWLNYGEESVLYVSPDVVSYTNGVWQMKDLHYWPKDGGTLTFFSWSLNKSDLKFNSNAFVEIKKEFGVCLSNFDITVDKGTDFIVADITADQTKNQDRKYYTVGVPTLFKHKLSSLTFTAETDEDYSASKRFLINSITITNLAKTGNYQQGEVIKTTNPWCWTAVDKWTVNGTYNAVYYNNTTGMEVTNTLQNVKGEQYYYIPQTFDETEVIEIHYQILDVKSNVTEDVVIKIPIKNVIETAFKVGTIYTINLRFHLDEILWDPAVEDWFSAVNEINI